MQFEIEFESSLSDSTWSKGIEKDKVLYLLDLFEERWEKGDLVCVVHLNDCANAGLCRCFIHV